jgi:FMN-dependent oxidoreductase (nitrilotriacetate monooxygenase family)
MTSSRQLHLGFTIWPAGFHPAGWRLPGAQTDGNTNAQFLAAMARTAERGKLDFFFIGDQVIGLPEWQYERPNQVLRPEALTLAGYIAGVTEKIGIVATVNTTYADPYSVARATATLDHLSGGRIGWNVVTGEAEAAAGNYNRKQHWDNARRYDWATEFTEVVKLLWDSWEDDARVADKASGRFVDEAKVHRIHHSGEFFSVEGPLNVQRPPQGQLPIVNAGRSDRSIEFGARFSDIKFTNSSIFGLAGAKAYYADLKGRLAKYGRDPDQQAILPGLVVYTDETAQGAHAQYRQIQELSVATFNAQALSEALGLDLAAFRKDTPISDVADPAKLTGTARSIVEDAQSLFGTDKVSLADIYLAYRRRPYFKEVVGDPRQIADVIEQWFTERAADGFMIFPPSVPGSAESFVNLVVPELQRRGLFRTEYAGSTLREHFNLPRPANHFTPTPTPSPIEALT